MSKNKIDTDECPHCGKKVNIYKGWITVENNRIISVNADWQCSECEETGKVDIGEMR